MNVYDWIALQWPGCLYIVVILQETNGSIPAPQELETFLSPEEKKNEKIVSKYVPSHLQQILVFAILHYMYNNIQYWILYILYYDV